MCSQSKHVQRIALLILLLWWSVGALAPGQTLADGGRSAEIREAIANKGLSWQTRDYGRDFPVGTRLDLEPKAQRMFSPDRAVLKALPVSIDWRNHGGNWVSPVKDQGRCGSCWAFASVAALEAQYALYHQTPGVFLDLSEQILVSCSTENAGCAGGYADVAAEFLRQQGTYHESCYPYAAADLDCGGACGDWLAQAYRLTDYEAVPQNVESIKAALQYGPLQTAYFVYDDFEYYAEGVYEYASGDQQGGHAVLVVGYADTPGKYGGGYFIVKNSWGERWGENGYFRIGYSQLANEVSFGKSTYRYHLAPVPVDEFEADNSAQQAQMITPGQAQTRSIRPAGDVDWVRFAVGQRATVVLETSGPGGEDTEMWLHAADLSQIAYDDDSGADYYSRIARTLDPGTYYARVQAFGNESVIGAYSLMLTAPDQPSLPTLTPSPTVTPRPTVPPESLTERLYLPLIVR